MRARLRRLFVDGTEGNERLTASTAAVLLVLLAVEGATILSIRPLLPVHVFVGMLLIPPVVLKLASTGYQFARFYLGARPYVVKGPPAVLARFLVAPVLVVSTVVLFATGIVAVFARGNGPWLGLHKVSFVLWFGALTIHVLSYARRLPRLVSAELRASLSPGVAYRRVLTLGALLTGIGLGFVALPWAESWVDPHERFEREGARAQRFVVADVASTRPLRVIA